MTDATTDTIGIVDLFSGLGGLTFGAREALGELGAAKLAVELNEHAAEAYGLNHPGARVINDSVLNVYGHFDEEISQLEQDLRLLTGTGGVLLGGPPCQGNSTLNNYTRGEDERNELYLVMARAAKIHGSELVIVENVPGVVNDKGGVLGRTEALFAAMGYDTFHGTHDLMKLGLPQSRKRHVMIATREPGLASKIGAQLGEIDRKPRLTIMDAIGHLVGEADSGHVLDRTVNSGGITKERIDYLFDNDVYDMPEHLRPDCHRGDAKGAGKYGDNYGRMYPDRPAPTITTCFSSLGSGRFAHPTQRRTLTPREAAVIQGLPEDLEAVGPVGEVRRQIGNVAPPIIAKTVIDLAIDLGLWTSIEPQPVPLATPGPEARESILASPGTRKSIKNNPAATKATKDRAAIPVKVLEQPAAPAPAATIPEAVPAVAATAQPRTITEELVIKVTHLDASGGLLEARASRGSVNIRTNPASPEGTIVIPLGDDLEEFIAGLRRVASTAEALTALEF